MDERGRRVGLNEAVFREVNRQIESIGRGLAAISDDHMHIVCECGDLKCADQLAVPLADYERIRSEPTWFFVLPGHEQLDVEEVIEETKHYKVVRKHEGEPARIARDTYRPEE